MFENCLADDAIRLLNGFSFTTPEDERTVQQIMDKFEAYAVGEINDTMERFLFHHRVQKEGEDFESFLTDTRRLSQTCKFCDDCKESMIRDRIVLGIRDDDTRQSLLKERNLSLDKCIDVCQAAQSASSHSRAIKPDVVARIEDRSKKPRRNEEILECKFCGTTHPMKKHKCPAYGESCSSCGGENHFAVKCPRKSRNSGKSRGKPDRRHPKSYRGRVHQVAEFSDTSDDSSSSSYDFCKAISSVPRKMIKCRMLVAGREVVFQVDTGATVNLLPAKYCTGKLEPYSGKMFMWDKSEFKPIGTTRVKMVNPKNGKKYSVPFLVYNDARKCFPILGNTTSQHMGLVKVEDENFEMVAAITEQDSYKEVFDESLGQLPGLQALKVRPDAQPTVMARRRVPIAVRPKLKEELNRLEGLDVIVPVQEPTPWVSQIVIAQKKSGKIRVCVDPHELNKVLLREHYTLPVLDDVLHELRHSQVFTKADLSSGYWHVKLDDESSKLTTFQTPYGRYRWLRLPFGLNVSSEIFQKRLLDAFADLHGIVCIADDIVVHGKTQDEHDANMRMFLQRCKELGVRLNKDKTESSASEITFMGHRITANGVQIDPEKVKAVTDLKEPHNVEELRRFLGMVNYVSKFLPNLTSELHPLHNLLRKDVSWNWSKTQQASFDVIKHNLTKTPVLAFYDPDRDLILENDASEYGLGSVMLQNGRPVAYASRTLSAAERRYAQIEKEMLAITYGLEKFHHFTYGREVKVVTDHKPLVAITNKPLSMAPRRLQNLLLKAMNYSYSLEYKPGTEIPVADMLSRAPTSKAQEEEVVNNITVHHMGDRRLNEIRGATVTDEVLMSLSETIVKGWPSDKHLIPERLRPYFHFRDELAVQDGVVMKGDRVVIPQSLRKEMKQAVHAGHLGINSCLRRAKDVMYWPGMSAELKEYIETCGTCATYQDKQTAEEPIISSVPPLPWQRVGVDIASYGGKDYLITVDYHSNYFEFDLLPDLLAATVIVKLKGQFARHGAPECLVSDNGTQFTAQNFKDFMRTWRITHETISPGNSRANGAAESAVKIFKRLLRKCKASNEDPFLGLLNLRNTPTAGMTTSPAQRLMGRRTRSLLPASESKLEHIGVPSREEAMRKEDKRVRESKTISSKLTMLNVGDNVRIQPYSKDIREWKEGKVERQVTSRSYEVTTPDGKKLRRNRQQLRAKPPSTHSQPPTAHHPRTRTTVIRSEPTENAEPQSIEKEETPVVKHPASPPPKVITRSGRVSKPPVRYSE